VDFLGSPLGFVNDVTEGVSGLLFEGNVQALVQNVTHGLSNSAAKVTGRTKLVSGFMDMHGIAENAGSLIKIFCDCIYEQKEFSDGHF
jgi:hypothetical protein